MLDGSSSSGEYWPRTVRGESHRALYQVGHTDMGYAFNKQAYGIRLRALTRALDAGSVQLAGRRVFEAGFGVGYYLEFWRREGAAVTGVDIAPTAVANVGRRFPTFDLRLGDVTEMDVWDDWESILRSFDLVTAIDILYHVVEDAKAARALKLLASLLQPGGTLIFTEKFPASGMPIREHSHVTRRPLNWYEEALGLGFRVERVAPVFWCMDPALPGEAASAGDRAARGAWVFMRACTKYFRSPSLVQEILGGATGYIGATIDRMAVGRMRSQGNMRIVSIRRTGN